MIISSFENFCALLEQLQIVLNHVKNEPVYSLHLLGKFLLVLDFFLPEFAQVRVDE